MYLIPLDHLAEKLALADQMLLPNELGKVSRSHPRGKRLGRGISAIAQRTFDQRHLPHSRRAAPLTRACKSPSACKSG